MNSNDPKNEEMKSKNDNSDQNFEVLDPSSKESNKKSDEQNTNWDKIGGTNSSKESLHSGAQETENELVNVKPSSKGQIMSHEEFQNLEDTNIQENTKNLNKNENNIENQYVTNDEPKQTNLDVMSSKELNIPQSKGLLSNSVSNQSLDKSDKENPEIDSEESRKKDRECEKKETSESNIQKDESEKNKTISSHSEIRREINKRISGYRRISITKKYNDKKAFANNIEKISKKRNTQGDMLSSGRTGSDKTLQQMKSKESPSESSMLNLREDIEPISKLKTESFDRSKYSDEQQKQFQEIVESQASKQLLLNQAKKSENSN
jgi:hypothetical protein